ncbi:hypothetical protein [Caudoviricetes sp.]|nr:hypothetical protein [Caudoviricetes sp.]
MVYISVKDVSGNIISIDIDDPVNKPHFNCVFIAGLSVQSILENREKIEQLLGERNE